MQRSKVSLTIAVILCLVGGACQKLKPQVSLLNGNQSLSSPSLSNGLGRWTLGSTPAPQSNGGYMLMGRVSYAGSPTLSNGSYKLSGTVRF